VQKEKKREKKKKAAAGFWSAHAVCPPSARQLRARALRLGRTAAPFPGAWRSGRRRVSRGLLPVLAINQINQSIGARVKKIRKKKQNQKQRGFHATIFLFCYCNLFCKPNASMIRGRLRQRG
jgi:hypothetical protein